MQPRAPRADETLVIPGVPWPLAPAALHSPCLSRRNVAPSASVAPRANAGGTAGGRYGGRSPLSQE